MTLYHFGNCLALLYVPYWMAYKYSGLYIITSLNIKEQSDDCSTEINDDVILLCTFWRSEYGAFYKCIQAGAIYVFTQLCKMLVLATFFPDTDGDVSSSVDFIGEFLKSTIDIADLVGMYIVLTGIPGKGHSKVLTAGIGWASAEVFLTRALMLWFGARGAEFDWKYIQKCLESNILLIQHITTATLVWLWGRHDLNKKLVPAVIAMLVLTPYKTLLLETIITILSTGPWLGLLIKASATLGIAGITLYIYTGLAQKLGIF